MITLKKSALLLAFALFCGTVFAQATDPANFSDNWTLFKSADGVNVYVRTGTCVSDAGIATDYIFFRAENTTENNLVVNFTTETWYNNKQTSGANNDPEHSRTIKLKPGQIKETDCTNEYRIILHETQGEGFTLTSFDLKNFTVSRQQ
jgi:hypothetical protein